jgi:NDP-sugar pyrophosphorylase family protein
MQVAILAGGLGARLKPLTETLPKPMVAINGKPFLEYQLEWLHRCGFRRILLLTGYLSDAIKDHFQDGRRFDLSIDYSVEATPLGTAGALKWAEPRLDDPFVLLNGDTYLAIDYRAMIARFQQAGNAALMAVYANADGIAPNNVTVSPEGLVSRYDKQRSTALTHVDAGAYVFRKQVLAGIPSGRACSLEGEIFPALVASGELGAYPVTDRYYDIGTFERLALAAQVIR